MLIKLTQKNLLLENKSQEVTHFILNLMMLNHLLKNFVSVYTMQISLAKWNSSFSFLSKLFLRKGPIPNLKNIVSL